MKCPKCGTVSPAEARFCSACGASLRDTSGDTTTMLPVTSSPAPDPAEARKAAEALAEAERQRVKDHLPAGNAMLMVTRGSADSNRFLIDHDVTTVGRHPESDIFLDDITVSRHHAKFVRSGGSLYLEDLGSLNGTYVNRTLLDGRSVLRDEDEIQIGKYRAVISLGE